MRKWFGQGATSLGFAVFVALLVRWAFMEAYVIPSGSMLPTLLVNDHIFVNKAKYGLRVPFTSDWLARWSQPKRGDVVVFKYPADPRYYYIKRVVGLPGDKIRYRKGYLYINGELIERLVPSGNSKLEWQWLSDRSFVGDQNGLSAYTHWEEALGEAQYSVLLNDQGARQIEYEPFEVPDRHLFVMGDNRDNSQDSRHWAPKAAAASGFVNFELSSDLQSGADIPAGTIVKTEPRSGGVSLRYKTLESVRVEPSQRVKVNVVAIREGLSHNIPAGQIKSIELERLGGLMLVDNPEPILGGNDFRYVPQTYIVGKAMFVWLSCEDTLPVLTFLCNPASLRWSRFFHKID